jgi:hypothetical protein
LNNLSCCADDKPTRRHAAPGPERISAGLRSIRTAGMGGISCVDRSDQYRRFAKECLEMARTSENEHTRIVLIQMAQVWFRLAEAHESGDTKKPPDNPD